MSTPVPAPAVKQPLSTIEATLLQLVSTVGGLAVGFGVFGSTTEQLIVSIAGIVLGAAVQVANSLHINALAKAGLLKR